MENRIFMTPRGFVAFRQEAAKQEAELRRLQRETAHAAEVGGNQYHDNASYEFLVLQIRTADRRLAETMELLNRVQVCEPPRDPTCVQLGTTITVFCDGREERWHIVGYGEGDWERRKISYAAPLAKMLIGGRPGESRTGRVGDRIATVTIKEVHCLHEEELGC